MKKLNVVDELNTILQDELTKIWDNTPVGYNVDNDGYHMGRGLITNKETWDKYIDAKLTVSELDPYDFIVDILRVTATKLNNDDEDSN